MEKNTLLSNSQQMKAKRIDSIDALRAFALFGILLVHISQLYNFDNSYNDLNWYTPLGQTIKEITLSLFTGRCRNIFCILFGVSFYLILRNPSYTTKRFIWRCLLLMCFGFINKLFFSTDILWWYGLNGIVLALLPIRNIQTRYILLLCIILYINNLIQIPKWNNYIFPEYNYTDRYIANISLFEYLRYPYFKVFKEQLHTFTGGVTETLAFFTLGYYLGIKGFINKIDHIITSKLLVISFLLYAFFRFFYIESNYLTAFRQLSELFGAFFYSIIFIFIFNLYKKWLLPLTNYGRLGLTNYTFQNLFWPVIILIVFIPLKISFEFVLLWGLLFYIIQTIFSSWWTKRYKYGPLEYIWRIATQRKFTSNKK